MYNLFLLFDEQREMLRSMDTIRADDIKKIVREVTCSKIKKVKTGKLRIINKFFPLLRDSELPNHEGHYVFYSFEKKNIFSFSKANRRVFIWPLGADKIWAVPFESVIFEYPENEAKENVLLQEQGEEQLVCKREYDGKEHECFFKKMQIFREFAVGKNDIVCTRDLAVHYYRWANPDPWVKENFTIKNYEKPMFYLRNQPRMIPGYSVQLSYPRRPVHYGFHVEE